MQTMANFTRHYPRFSEIMYWRDQGYILDPTPRIPSLDESWKEPEIAGILNDEIQKAKTMGCAAILIGGLSNVMAYAWFIAATFGFEVIQAKGKRSEDGGFIIVNHTRLLAPAHVARRLIS